MRPIEFRAWNTKTKVMLDCYKMTPLALHPDLVDKQDGLFIPFHEDLILEQFTGLLDKNGVKVFEGDIVLLPSPSGPDSKAIVFWEKKTASFVLKGFGENSDWREEWYRKRFYYGTILIIGNIHQNSELLK